MSRFKWTEGAGFGYLRAGDAGFTGSALSFKDGEIDSLARALLSQLAAGRLLLLSQCHGTEIVDLKASEFEQSFEPVSAAGIVYQSKRPFDGIRLLNSEKEKFKGAVLGIKTADCIPLILIGREQTVLLHAGWRGLAAGIIEAALQQDWEGGQAFIGPCAGAQRYEVGPEVLAALGARAVFRPVPGGKALLDLAATAEKILCSVFAPSQISVSGVCTISDRRFHSFRRDGAKAGRNISFIAIG
ncbi:MAG: polyphenol oxidase family protein [Oligoflexia bacterium]|nr:polyphenol oxidase family protein [Oligoflexia bacterium]